MRFLPVVVLAFAPGLRAQAPYAHDVAFSSDGLQIPGTLEMPSTKGSQGVPLVILVQGSGPSDRDETIGPNKVFRDLAEGLAAQGIATLRYDKRTWLMKNGKIPVTPGDLGKVSLATEVVDDAVAALAFGAAQPGIDPHRVFVLGHSLGGTMAPRIAHERIKAQAGSVRGLIEMAGAALPANVVIQYQTAFQSILHGQSEEAMQKSVAQLDDAFRKALDPATPADQMVIFAPASYLREWVAVDAAADLRAVALPALVLHGGKDVQVGYPDFVLLARAAVAPGSHAQEFAGLNHLMMPVAGEGTGAEYATPSHVSPEVIRAIAEWVRGLP